MSSNLSPRDTSAQSPRDTSAQPPRDTSAQASDDDRIQVAQLLSEAASNGRLSIAEYESRLGRAYSATSFHQLERVTYDLPEGLEFRRRKSRPAPSTMLLAIMSGFERRGRWNVPGRMTTFTLLGGGVVDLRYADFTCPTVEIHAYSIFGGQTILLPPEVNVDIKGRGVMGGFDNTVEGSGTPGAPRITIKGFSLCGGVGIKRCKRAERPQ